MDIFHFPRLNNTFLGLSRPRRKNFAGTKKVVDTVKGMVHKSAPRRREGRQGAEALGWFIDK